MQAKNEYLVGENYTTGSRVERAKRDVMLGLRSVWLWTALAVQDLRLRYRGSMLGPFWITLSTAVMVVAMGGLYPYIFRINTTQYLPYLVCGLVVWQYMSVIIADGCQTFIIGAGMIQQVRLPFSVHACRIVFRTLLVLAHNAVLIPIVLLFTQTITTASIVLLVPALGLYAVVSFGLCILLGMLSARFRDVPQIIGSVLQIAFFVTPIFWSADSMGRLQTVVELNPLFAFVDITRAPLIGKPFAPYSWAVAIVTTVLICSLAGVLFVRLRGRIAYWV